MPDTEARTRESTRGTLLPPPVSASPSCVNCGALLTGPYCSNCGQHVADFHRSVWRFAADFFDNTFCWDNKLFRTLGPLFKRPGFLTLEFMRGRRVRYVHPLRLFLFTSAVCLTLLQFTYNHSTKFKVERSSDLRSGKAGVHFNFGTPPPFEKGLAPAPVATVAAGGSPSAAAALPASVAVDQNRQVPALASSPPAKSLRKQIKEELAKNHGEDGEDAQKKSDELGQKIDEIVENKIEEAGDEAKLNDKIVRDVQQRLSWVALILLPVFALGLRALYWNKDSYYFGHLVFSLHYHTFLLLYFALFSFAQTIADHLPLHTLVEWIMTPAIFIPPTYLYLSLRQMFGESRRLTVVKVLLLGFMHLLLIVIGVSAVGTYSFFF